MAVTLIGEIVNSCDIETDFNQGNISGDDDFVEGTGAIGLKASSVTVEIYTSVLGLTAPYNFASGGSEFGYHIIMWFNTKTPIDATTGLTVIVGDGTNRARWNVLGSGFYKGGFITRVISTSADFNTISTGAWTLTGNPVQLNNITQMGGGFTTTTSIMGNFNNVQLDQITIGLGLRVDAGTVTTPNTFETVRVVDEDTEFYGWWSSSNGAFIGKGKLFIGPQTGTATSVFTDENFSVVFSDSLVAVGFYEINMRGTNTDVTWTLGNITAANPTNAKWNLTVDSTTKSFSVINNVWSGADILTLNANSSLVGTTIINSNSLITNGASLTEITALSPSDTEFVVTNDLEEMLDCSFDSSGTGHAIQLNSLGTGQMSWRNFLSGYATNDGSTGNEAIFVNVASGNLTINIIAGYDTPSIRTAGAVITKVVAPVTTTLTVIDVDTSLPIQNARVFLRSTTNNNYFSNVTPTSVVSDGGVPNTVTVTHSGSNIDIVAGDLVLIRGADQEEYNGTFSVVNGGSTSYTYEISGTPTSPATGAITHTHVYFNNITDANGEISDTRSLVANEPVSGRVRRATNGTYYKSSPVSATINQSNGLSLRVNLIPDE